MKQDAQNPFWNFSVTVYGREGVADACLRLQDGFGIDVNILLYCCWIAKDAGVALDETGINRILTLTSPWKLEVVAPLRAIRRVMKNAFDGFSATDQEALRTAVKRIELNAERLQQDALYDAFIPSENAQSDQTARKSIAANNVDRYSKTLDASIDAAGRDDISHIIDMIFAPST